MAIRRAATAGASRAAEHAIDQVGVGVVDTAVDVGNDDARTVNSDAVQPRLIAGECLIAAVDVVDVDLAGHLRSKTAIGRNRMNRIDAGNRGERFKLIAFNRHAGDVVDAVDLFG